LSAFLLVAGPLAIICTKLVDTLRNIFDPAATKVPKVVWNLASFVIGIVIALAYQADIHALIPGLPPVLDNLTGIGGQVLTGLAIGAVASGWHEFFDLMSSVAKRG
jgi:hypothetical protein